MSAEPYDFTVIGGGSAGYAAARIASALGLRTAVVEGGARVGGLCILHGCMPSKTLVESANRFISLRRAKEFGLRAEGLEVHNDEIQARKQRLIDEFADHRRGQLEKGPFDFIRGRARFTDAHHLDVDGRIIESRAFLIATGSHIQEVDIPGLKETGYLTSDDTLDMERLPRSAVVLGAGAVGLEAAHHLSGLGVEVTVLQRGEQVMRETDADVARALQDAMTEHGVRFFCGATLKRVEAGKTVHFERGGKSQSVTAEEIVFALGRSPSTGGLDADRAGVELDKRGRVSVGKDQRSSVSHIFAAGDVCGPHEIVHIGIQQGELAARNVARKLGKLAGKPDEIDYRLKLFCLFTQPQAASVGLTEREAEKAGLDYAVACHPFADHGKAMVIGETHGFVKLIAEKTRGEIIGGAVVGPDAAELIHEIVVAMHFRATAADLSCIPHYHPTLSEIWTYPAEELAGIECGARPGDEEIARKH